MWMDPPKIAKIIYCIFSVFWSFFYTKEFSGNFSHTIRIDKILHLFNQINNNTTQDLNPAHSLNIIHGLNLIHNPL